MAACDSLQVLTRWVPTALAHPFVDFLILLQRAPFAQEDAFSAPALRCQHDNQTNRGRPLQYLASLNNFFRARVVGQLMIDNTPLHETVRPDDRLHMITSSGGPNIC